MKDSMNKIGFSAYEEWTVMDLQVFFHQLNILYNRLYVINGLKPGMKVSLDGILNNSLAKVRVEEQLRVDYIEIHSPAEFSFIGLDKIIAQLRDLIKDLTYRNKLESQMMEQKLLHSKRLNDLEVQSKEMAIFEKQIGIMKEAGFSTKEIQDASQRLIDPAKRIAAVMMQRSVVVQNSHN